MDMTGHWDDLSRDLHGKYKLFTNMYGNIDVFKAKLRLWGNQSKQHNSDYILITKLMHWLLFIHKILFPSTCFEPQVLIFRRIQLYTCSIWYCHSLWEFLVTCRYTAWVRTDWRGKVVGGCLKTPTNNLPPVVNSWCTVRKTPSST